MKTITVDKSSFFAKESPDMLAAKMGTSGGNSMMWIVSIFITGLGQILMGDTWRGFRFIWIEIFLKLIKI